MKHLLSLLIIVYGMNGCGWCDAQLKELNRMHIDYKYVLGDTTYTRFPTMVNENGAVHQGYLEGGDLIAFLNAKGTIA